MMSIVNVRSIADVNTTNTDSTKAPFYYTPEEHKMRHKETTAAAPIEKFDADYYKTKSSNIEIPKGRQEADIVDGSKSVCHLPSVLIKPPSLSSSSSSSSAPPPKRVADTSVTGRRDFTKIFEEVYHTTDQAKLNKIFSVFEDQPKCAKVLSEAAAKTKEENKTHPPFIGRDDIWQRLFAKMSPDPAVRKCHIDRIPQCTKPGCKELMYAYGLCMEHWKLANPEIVKKYEAQMARENIVLLSATGAFSNSNYCGDKGGACPRRIIGQHRAVQAESRTQEKITLSNIFLFIDPGDQACDQLIELPNVVRVHQMVVIHADVRFLVFESH